LFSPRSTNDSSGQDTPKPAKKKGLTTGYIDANQN
jgi:hypothetical protein